MITVTNSLERAGPGPGVAPAVLIDPQDPHPIQACRVVDQQGPAGVQDGVVDCVPGRSETPSDAGYRHTVDDHGLQRPEHRSPAQLRPRRGSGGGVLAPHVPTPRTAVPAHRDVQDRGPPPHRDVRQPAQHRVSGHPKLAAPGAPAGPLGDLVGLHNPAREHRVIGTDLLAGDGQPEPVDQAERIKIRAVESRLSHVEVFQMGSVRTSIIGGPRPLPPHRRANSRYTLKREEPSNGPSSPTAQTGSGSPTSPMSARSPGGSTARSSWTCEPPGPRLAGLDLTADRPDPGCPQPGPVDP